MSLQKHIIQEYRTHHPRHTLRETSLLTGIQLTRVFRIFNGSPMKLHEYESFHQAVHAGQAVGRHDSGFRRVAEQLARRCSDKELAKLTSVLERHLRWNEIATQTPSSAQSGMHIA